MAAASDAVIEGIAGAIGACISLTATYPLLTVSTLRALELRDDKDGSPTLASKLRAVPGPIRDVVQYAQASGWRSLFSGLRPAILATAASQGIYFTVYSRLRQLAVAHKAAANRRRAAAAPQALLAADGGHSEGISVGASLLVASVAGCVNVLLTNPIWVVITQLQALQRHGAAVASSSSALTVAAGIWREGGPLGFFKGLWPSMVMVVNPTLQYIVYESLVARALDMRRAAAAARVAKVPPGAAAAAAAAPHVLLGAGDIFLLSAAAKVVATLVTYPMLVIKNRLQAINRHTEEQMQYQGVWHAIRSMAAAEGLAGFYKGMRVKLLQTVLAAALLMVLKEKIFLATRAALAPAAAAAAARRAAGI